MSPLHVLMFNESNPIYSSFHDFSNSDLSLANSFLLSELQNANKSRRSLACGLGSISSLFIKNLPINVIKALLTILNNLFSKLAVLESWHQIKVIPVPKLNVSPVTYRPIAMSSSICKHYLFCLIKYLAFGKEWESINISSIR